MIQTDVIPDEYCGLDPKEVDARIEAAKRKLGNKLTILGHYYQRDEVVRWADHQGDSFQLARFGARADAEHVVFCGVKFMAESSAVLAREGQRVYLPAMDAGCPLADMADVSEMRFVWQTLTEAGAAKDFLPVVYMNSSAQVKAFCGELGGTVCTSSSADRAFQWVAAQGKKVFFLPDENLGINTALAEDIARTDILEWSAAGDLSLQAKRAREAKSVVWKGFCHVHTFFTTEHVHKARQAFEGCRIAVHPESSPDVVAASDASGSTSFLKKYAEEAPQGSTVVIGTEINFVSRLARENPGKRIVPLARSLCPNMFRTSPADLLWVLERIGEVNEIVVDEATKESAKLALERMLKL